ncbi:MAG: peptidoglycan DD-metalloendopeptidase family protein [Chloroflexota bacterium]
MKRASSSETELPLSSQNQKERLLSTGAWLAALACVALAFLLSWRAFLAPLASRPAGSTQQLAIEADPDSLSPSLVGMSALPEPIRAGSSPFVSRRTALHTIIPNRPRQEIINYQVQQGDSIFEIAARFFLRPESVLWANYAQLNDNPDLISIGMSLNIPSQDGVLYEWQEGDTFEAVAARLEAQVEDILNWPGNDLDLTNPTIDPGTLILVPGGHREFRQWLIPTIPRGSAGVSKSVYGAGACEGSYDGALGTGSFIWPVSTHTLSGNDYWSGHLAIDIGAAEGAQVYASDSGVVVFAGWSNGGYGNTVMIDHGNGYQTLYGHLSKVSTGCGRSVSQGAVIGYAGSTGNSTGTHLHFEVRYLGGFINPWYVLP